MTVLSLTNFISYVDTKIKGITHWSNICRNSFSHFLYHATTSY